MEGFFVKVEPKIIYPACLKAGKKQDCFQCQNKEHCKSPRSMCVLTYKNHKKGCPNYGKRMDCPPSVPMFDQVFDMTEPIYAIFSIYDLKAHIEKMKQRHPEWTETQLRNVLYWQGTAKKQLRKKICEFEKIYREKGYYATCSPEAMGVDVTYTLKKAGITLEWPVTKDVYKVAFAGIPLDDKYLHLWH